MELICEELIAHGHEVQIPQLSLDAPAEFGGEKKINFAKYIEEHGGMEAFPVGHQIWDLKESAIQEHFQKMDWADAILVINEKKREIEGYIGGNTFLEIGVAYYSHKKIYILNAISLQVPYLQEIYAMKPILLDGDLSKI